MILASVIVSVSFIIGLQPFDNKPSVLRVIIEGSVYYVGVGIMEELYLRGLLQNLIEKCFGNIDNIDNSRIMFLHGTKGNEVVSAKAAKLMKEIYPQTVVKCFKGYAHAELAIYHSNEWIKTVDEFIS